MNLAGFEVFTRERWAALGDQAGSTLSASEATPLVATGEPVSLDEVTEIYLPLAQLLALLAEARRDEHRGVGQFLGRDRSAVPFVLGVAGSVASGKSTAARVLQELLRRSAGTPTVDVLTTDGFLYPNVTLEAKGLMERKGFPESYDQRRLVQILSAIRAGDAEVTAPVYTHLTYDVVPGAHQVFHQPDFVIVEGLNVLQVNTKGTAPPPVVVSDLFDFSIYVDAAEEDLARWFTKRLLALRAGALQQPESFFHRFSALPEEEVSAMADQVWADINLVNLRQNVAPTRGRANLILEKDRQHCVQRILLRRA
jgi:type I pantothenate kinase